jgi:hypothetical protein
MFKSMFMLNTQKSGASNRLIMPLTLSNGILLWSPSESLSNRKSLAYVFGTLPKVYIRNVPLPRVPPIQSAKSQVQVHIIPDYYKAKYAVPAYNTPSSIVESAVYAFSPAWQDIAINT